MTDTPLLSIIIPTRERAGTLRYTLETTLAQNSDAFEVLVSDNCSGDETPEVVASIRDPRVRYVRADRRLSMCDNYEFALENSRGRHTIIVGDDDAALPGQIDALISRIVGDPTPMIYMWPLHIYDWPSDRAPAQLTYFAPAQEPQTVALKELAREAVRLGGWKYYALPSGYHSAIPRNLTHEIAARTGRVFHSTQPDVFVAMALPAFADIALNLGVPVTMNGRSPKSNGRDFLRKSERRNLDRFIAEYSDYRFHPMLGTEMSPLAAMIPDAVLRAKDLFPEVYSDVDFGFGEMWAYVARLGFVSHGEVLRQRKHVDGGRPFSLAKFLGYSALHQAAAFRRSVLNRVVKPKGLRKEAPSNIRDTALALSALENQRV